MGATRSLDASVPCRWSALAPSPPAGPGRSAGTAPAGGAESRRLFRLVPKADALHDGRAVHPPPAGSSFAGPLARLACQSIGGRRLGRVRGVLFTQRQLPAPGRRSASRHPRSASAAQRPERSRSFSRDRSFACRSRCRALIHHTVADPLLRVLQATEPRSDRVDPCAHRGRAGKGRGTQPRDLGAEDGHE